MESSGKVVAINGKKVTLRMYRESTCSHCSGCGEDTKVAKELVLEVDQDVEIGDIVTFQMKDSKFLKIGFLVYIVPIIMMIIGFNVGTKLGYTEKGSAALSFLFLAITFGVIHLIDRFLVKEKVQMEVLKVEKDDGQIDQDTCDVKH